MPGCSELGSLKVTRAAEPACVFPTRTLLSSCIEESVKLPESPQARLEVHAFRQLLKTLS
jgi:hypothetical protein